MWIYFLLFFLVLYLYKQSNGSKQIKQNALFVMIGFGVFVGLGDMLGGYDRYIYGEIFDDSADIRMGGGSVHDVLYQGGAFEEKGYMLYNYILSYFTANRYIYILITTLFIFLSFYYAFVKYVKANILYSIILFEGLFVFITFTYMREVLAMCITFWALKACIERRMLLFFVIVALAYTFHHSAVILLPIYFIPLKKWDQKTILTIAIICFILGFLGLSRLGFTAFSAITGGNSRADNYASEYEVEGYFRIDYVMEAVFFLYCILSLYRHVGKDKRSLVLLNYSLVFCFVLLLFTRSAQGGRLSWYFLIGIIVLVSELVCKEKTHWKQGLIVVSFLLFARIVNDWGILLSPYKTFLTDGFRPGDPIHQKYEYDEKYDADKFYRDPWLLW